MAQEFFRYETPYGRPRQRTNYFAWTLAILFLTGFAFAAWLGSFYVFWQPERPDSYRLLKKLHRIDPPRRFELTASARARPLRCRSLPYYRRPSTWRRGRFQFRYGGTRCRHR